MIMINSKILFYERTDDMLELVIDGFPQAIVFTSHDYDSDERSKLAEYIELKLKEQEQCNE